MVTTVLTEMNILLVAFIMYLICLFLFLKFKIKWLFIATSVLWFIPIMLIDNIFIVVFSVIMIIITFVITFFNKEDNDF
jgi:hypothetical protein